MSSEQCIAVLLAVVSSEQWTAVLLAVVSSEQWTAVLLAVVSSGHWTAVLLAVVSKEVRMNLIRRMLFNECSKRPTAGLRHIEV